MPCPAFRHQASTIRLVAAVAWSVAVVVSITGEPVGRAAEPAAEDRSAQLSPKEIRDLLNAAQELLSEGKLGKAAARVAEAAEGIEQIAKQGGKPAALRGLWEKCRSLRNDLELEGADVSSIPLTPLKVSATKPVGKPAAATAASPAKPVAKPPPLAAAKPAATFTGKVTPILVRHCGGCHIEGRKGGFQMVSYAGLMKTGMVQPGQGESSRLVEAILNGDMPRGGGKVPPEDLGVLMKWIDMGAPFDGTDPNAPLGALAREATAVAAAPPSKPVVAVKLKPGEVSFAADIAPVLVEQCSGCHGATQPESNLSMVTLERLLRGGRGGAPIVSGQAAASLLVKKLKGGSIEGQRMPLGKPPLADDVIATIVKWIDQGSKLDLLTPQTDLETVASAGRAQKLSHHELQQVRFKAGSSLWTRVITDEKAVVIQRGDVLIVGNLITARMDKLADAAEAVDRRLRDDVWGPQTPLIKGGVVVYGFAKGYDLSSFWQTVLSDERPKGVNAGAGVSGDVVYAAIVPPAADKDDATADVQALLTEQMTAAALLGRGVPAWFARGAGRGLAMKAEPKAPLVLAWRRELPMAMQRCGSPADLFTGSGEPTAMAVVGGSFIAAMMPNPSRLETLVKQLDEGVAFEQAFATVFRGQPQPLFEAWLAHAVAKGPKRSGNPTP